MLLLEATNTYLQSVPIAYHMDGTSALVNNFCAVLFFDEQNALRQPQPATEADAAIEPDFHLVAER